MNFNGQNGFLYESYEQNNKKRWCRFKAQDKFEDMRTIAIRIIVYCHKRGYFVSLLIGSSKETSKQINSTTSTGKCIFQARNGFHYNENIRTRREYLFFHPSIRMCWNFISHSSRFSYIINQIIHYYIIHEHFRWMNTKSDVWMMRNPPL